MIIKLDYFFYVLGAMLLMVAWMALRDPHNPKRYSSALFWALYAVIYLAGEQLPPVAAGLLMVLMALIAGFGGVTLGRYGDRSGRTPQQRAAPRPQAADPGAADSRDHGDRLHAVQGRQVGWPVPARSEEPDAGQPGCGSLFAVATACWLTRSTPMQAMRESRRLIDHLGWAVVLPHMLAVLGLLFTEAGMGKAVAHVVTSYINMDIRLVAVAVYCIGMALFTIIMGNGFAAFPVMAGGVGIPVLVGVYHANPAVMAAIGMFSAYCGTLMTPMAANFNIVPAALLELPDKNAVVKMQVATALPLLLVNISLLYFLMNM
jgi:uncharacterized membrane protein